jgi:hypothetical protein
MVDAMVPHCISRILGSVIALAPSVSIRTLIAMYNFYGIMYCVVVYICKVEHSLKICTRDMEIQKGVVDTTHIEICERTGG